MPWYKLQMNFTQLTNGWNEEYYKWFVDTPASNSPSDSLINARLSFCGEGVILRHIRWIDQEGDRRSVIRTPNLTNKNLVGNGQTTSPVTVAAVTRLHGLNGTDRRVWMRGLRQDYVKLDENGRSLITAPFQASMDAFVAALSSNAYAIRAQSQEANVPWSRISQWAESTEYPGWTQFVVAGGNPLGVGTTVYFGGKFPCCMEKITTDQQIEAITDGNVHHIAHPWPAGMAAQNTATSRVRERVWQYQQIRNIWDLIYFRGHDTGRPTGLPRGRRRTQECAR